MAFYTFSAGTLAKSSEVNANFDSVIYSILYNRMEKDQAAYTQIDPTIQSDQFSDADGRYNTLCVAGTTSNFNTNHYKPMCIYPAQFTTTENCYLCCVNFSPCGQATCATSNNTTVSVCAYGCRPNVSPYCVGNAYVCLGRVTNNTTYKLCNYNYMCVNLTACHRTTGCATSNCCWNAKSNLIMCNVNSLCLNTSAGGRNISCCAVFEFCACAGNYDVYYNASCVCNISGDFYVNYNLNVYACATGGSFNDYWAMSCASAIISECTHLVTNTLINSNIKNYATPRNAAMLVTNSVLPAGNCIRYDIKNQAGCTYLANAEPDKVYNLCAADSCCFYAVIKQNIECNLCTPQCMFGYALKLM